MFIIIEFIFSKCTFIQVKMCLESPKSQSGIKKHFQYRMFIFLQFLHVVNYTGLITWGWDGGLVLSTGVAQDERICA